MATTTTNLGLTLPAVSDAADIGVLNTNFQKLDEKCNPALFAPSGCGYGDDAPYIGAEAGQSYTDKIDALVASWPNMTAKQYATYDANQSTYAMLATIYKYSSQATLIVAHSFTGSIVTRKKESGVWKDWEWVNPPMKLGVEYRTTERYNELPVYVKLVDCGSLPNAGTKNVYLGDNIAGENVVSFNVKLLSGTKSAHMLPWLDTSFAGQASAYISATGQIQFVTKSDMSAYTATVTVKYTKP